MLRTFLPAAAVTLTLAAPAAAHEYKVGDIVIDRPVARATVPGAKVGAGYMVLKNTGTTDDALMGGASSFAGKVEIHEGKIENGVMSMREFPDGLVIPAGESVILKPGGNHVMFMQLAEPLAEGEKRKVTLKFRESGETEVEFQVKSIADTMKMGDGKTMKMNHSGHDDN